MKKFFSLLLLLFVISIAYAQDTIQFNNGKSLVGKVLEVGTSSVTFKKQENLDGPNYVFYKSEIRRIIYSNGTIDNFSVQTSEISVIEPKNEPTKIVNTKQNAYGRNLVAFAPLQLSNFGIGVALRYERMIDKNQFLGFNLPIMAAFNNSVNSDNGSYYQNDSTNNTPINNMFILAPGLKLYPGGSCRTFRYSVGPSLLLGIGRETKMNVEDIYDDQGYYLYTNYNYDTKRKYLFGLMINNSLNFTINKKFYFGGELGIGVNYKDLFDSKDLILGNELLIQLSFQLGYRF